MRLIKSKIIFALMLILFSQTAQAQNGTVGTQGADRPLFEQDTKTDGYFCYVYQKYVVRIIPADEGDTILILRRNLSQNFKTACSDQKALPLMKVNNIDFSSFFGLKDDIFLVDSGTSAGFREVYVFSLISKKEIFKDSYWDSVTITENTIIYEKASPIKGSPKNCRDWRSWKKSGGGIDWVQRTKFDFLTRKETVIGNPKCVYLE